MNESESSAAWNYGAIDEDQPIDASDVFPSEPPLQFAALYAQSQPDNGRVTIGKLGAILNRAKIANDKSALILEYSTEGDTTLISESMFYWALSQATKLQEDETHLVTPPVGGSQPSDFSAELQLEEDSIIESHDFTISFPEYTPYAEPLLTVSVSSREAGSYFFRHAVYSIDGVFHDKSVKVLRRYRDFSKFVSILTRKYPFRLIPMLPPKRLTLNGRYLVGEDQKTFLERRAAGLSRFVNLLVQHPVLSQDPMTAEFLMELAFYPEEITKEETSGKIADPIFISTWNPETATAWTGLVHATQGSVDEVTSMCVLVERRLKRLEAEQADQLLAAKNFNRLSELMPETYPLVEDDIPSIQQRLDSGTTYAEKSAKRAETCRKALQNGPLEQLKLYREMLNSVLDLFQRTEKMGGNTITDLKKRIANAQRKLVAASAKETVADEELHRLRTVIQASQNEIREQTNRDWLVKMIVTQETKMVQAAQYQVSKFLRSLAEAVSADLAKVTESTTAFTDSAESAPLKVEFSQ